jgi:mannose-6-phosphate isomerase-like protein (cupin superfamily)
MQESSYLNGRVLKWSLPVIEGNPPADAPRLKRLALAQGELAHFSDGEKIDYIAFVELRLGGTRGNHYHQKKEEAVYVIRGEMVLFVQDIQTRERTSLTLQAGDLAVVPIRIAHAYQTTQPGDAVEFSKARFDAADVHRYPLV